MVAAAESVVCTRMAKVQPRGEDNTRSHQHTAVVSSSCFISGKGINIPGGRGLNEASLVLIFNKTDRKSRSNFSKCSSSLHHKRHREDVP